MILLPDPQVILRRHILFYGGIGLLETMCSAFDLALLNGTITFPAQWAWVTVLLQPVLVYATMNLPKLTDSPAALAAKRAAAVHGGN